MNQSINNRYIFKCDVLITHTSSMWMTFLCSSWFSISHRTNPSMKLGSTSFITSFKMKSLHTSLKTLTLSISRKNKRSHPIKQLSSQYRPCWVSLNEIRVNSKFSNLCIRDLLTFCSIRFFLIQSQNESRITIFFFCFVPYNFLIRNMKKSNRNICSIHPQPRHFLFHSE